MQVATSDSKKERLKRGFLKFSEGTPFEKDAIEICNLLENVGSASLKLIALYTNKIVAVHKQDYEEAAEIRDKIKELNPLQTQQD
jgi:excinuclease UvrABC nuclease subunit